MSETNGTSTASTAANGTTVATDSEESVVTDKSAVEEALHNAFMLGWGISELKSRILIALYEPNENSLRLASIWRAIFNKIAVLQLKTFPGCATSSTLYDPPSAESLPYLYPPTPDYANVGIPEKNADGTTTLSEFKLYEVTRRAINCLTILYVKEKDSLVPEMITKFQGLLTTSILKAASHPESGGGDAEALEGAPPESLTESRLQEAIKILTERTDKFLEAWDGFLRENFYAGGKLPENDSELAAYEAGRAISLLSWGITEATVGLEYQQKANPQTDLTEKFIDAWQYTFRDAVVIRIQHQISALSSILDDVYYSKAGKKRPDADADTELIAPDPDLPSQTIRAIKLSLDYWHRTVKWISKKENRDKLRNKGTAADSVSWSKPMRSALIQQANIWQTLIIGQQNLRAFNMESVSHKLMQDLTEEIQKNLHSGFKSGMDQAQEVMKEMTAEVKVAINTATSAAKAGVQSLFTSFKWILWPLIGVGAVCLVLLIISFLNPGALGAGGGGLSGATGILGALSALVGYFRFDKNKNKVQATIKKSEDDANTLVDSQTDKTKTLATSNTESGNGFFSRVEGAAQETGKVIMDAFSRAYKQIRIELSGLNQSTAVSYPLVEFFIASFTLTTDAEFLTEIIWSGKERSEEIKRVLGAAFGPLAVFINPSVGKKEIQDS